MTAGPSSSSPFVAFIDLWGAFIPSFILLTLKGKNRECFYCLLFSTLALNLLQNIQPPNAQKMKWVFLPHKKLIYHLSKSFY